MPCRKWNDFLPKTLELTDVAGKILSGTYDITYACYFVYSNGAKVESQLNWKHLHTFELHEGLRRVATFRKTGISKTWLVSFFNRRRIQRRGLQKRNASVQSKREWCSDDTTTTLRMAYFHIERS